MSVTYRQSGVDIEEASQLVDRIKPLAAKTHTEHVMSAIGGFAGLCQLPPNMKEPVLVSGTDGVGTKLKVAFAVGKHDTIGQDLVAMCVNDIITTGAEPLFFLDYFGTGRLQKDVGEAVVNGIADGCQLAGCALLGGETAELPGMYADGEYDLAGFAVGVVEKSEILGAERVRKGDQILAIASSGLHSNGYSLARRVIETEMRLGMTDEVDELNATVGDTLLQPTRIYAKTVKKLREALGADLHALCHVTGGGLPENLPRVLPAKHTAVVDGSRLWPVVFQWLADGGPIDLWEMRRTFNLGIGLTAVVDDKSADKALEVLSEQGEDAWRLGRVEEGSEGSGVEYRDDPEDHRA